MACLTCLQELDVEETLDVFKFDADYVANEDKYAQVKKEILGSESDEEEEEDEDDDEEDVRIFSDTF